MLKCVVYVVTAYGYGVLLKHREAMEKQLLGEGIQLLLFKTEETGEMIGEATEFVEEGFKNVKETLFITDAPHILKILTEKNKPAAVFSHEGNRGISFGDTAYVLEKAEELTGQTYEETYRRLIGQPWDILTTKRLFVRESTVADVPEFYRIYGEETITRYMDDLFQDPEEEKAYMEDYIRQFYGFYGFGMWTVIFKETGRVIGRAGLSLREGYEYPELGFVIERDFQRKGLADEVCRAILQYAKGELFFDKVQAFAEPENEASMNLLKKLGFHFVKEERLKDQVYYLFLWDNSLGESPER